MPKRVLLQQQSFFYGIWLWTSVECESRKEKKNSDEQQHEQKKK